MNLSMNLKLLLRKFARGVATARPSTAGMMLPVTANKKVLGADSPSLNPSGMASLSSANGVIALNRTINSGLMRLIYSRIYLFASMIKKVRQQI